MDRPRSSLTHPPPPALSPKARKGGKIVRPQGRECGNSWVTSIARSCSSDMEDNGDVGHAWTPDFPTRYLRMMRPERLNVVGTAARNPNNSTLSTIGTHGEKFP